MLLYEPGNSCFGLFSSMSPCRSRFRGGLNLVSSPSGVVDVGAWLCELANPSPCICKHSPSPGITRRPSSLEDRSPMGVVDVGACACVLLGNSPVTCIHSPGASRQPSSFGDLAPAVSLQNNKQNQIFGI